MLLNWKVEERYLMLHCILCEIEIKGAAQLYKKKIGHAPTLKTKKKVKASNVARPLDLCRGRTWTDSLTNIPSDASNSIVN